MGRWIFISFFALSESSFAKSWTELLNGVEKVNSQQCLVAASPTPNPCTELSKISCMPGLVSDGTGASWRGSQSELIDREKAWIDPIGKNYIQKQIKTDPKFKAYLIKEFQKKDPEKRPLSELTEQNLTEFGFSLGMLQSQKRLPFLNRVLKRKQLAIPGSRRDRFEGLYQHLEKELSKIGPELEIEKRYREVQDEMLSYFRERLPEGKERDALLKTIRDTKFGGGGCGGMRGVEKDQSRFDLITNKIPHYDPKTEGVRYCGMSLRHNTSLFEIYFTLAHELAHSVSNVLCESLDEPTLSCFRSKESVEARIKRDKTYRSCGRKDQMSEVFPDFFATEVLTRLIPKQEKMRHLSKEQFRAGFANILREPMPCEDLRTTTFDPHPNIEKRQDRIIMAHPQVQELTGCTGKTAPDLKYCGTPLSGQ